MKPIQRIDGAFGTYYLSLTGDERPCELANVERPGTVLQIHREYVEAGAQFIKTNTFCANSTLFPDRAERDRILREGYRLACRSVEGTDVRVLADIGPIACDDPSAAAKEYCEIAEVLLQEGAQAFLFETMGEYHCLKPAAAHIKARCPSALTAVSFAVSQDGYSRKGLFYRRLLGDAAANEQVDAVGLNCVCGPTHMLELIEKAGELGKPLLAMPNAGYPSTLNGRTVFQDNARYYGEKLALLAQVGVTYLGGCCGTTPRHMKTAYELLKKEPGGDGKVSVKSREPQAGQTVRQAHSIFEKQGKIYAVELDPPVDYDLAFLTAAAQRLKEAGVDAVTIADSPLARTRADSIMTAAYIRRNTGVEVIPHMSCRDRNHIAIKGALLGAAFENIQHLLAVTGDPAMQDVFMKQPGVFKFNSFQLISYVSDLNRQVFFSRPMQVGGALNVNAPHFESELKRAEKKAEAGASFFMTQPLFTRESEENLRRAYETLPCKILAGILPVASYKNAVFLNNEVSGVHIPEAFCQQLLHKTPEEVAELSAAFSREIMERVSPWCHGYYIMTPLKKVELVCRLLRR